MGFFDTFAELNIKEVIEENIYNNCTISKDPEIEGDEIKAYISSPSAPPGFDIGLAVGQQKMLARIFIKSLNDINLEILRDLKGRYLKDLDHQYLFEIYNYKYVNDYVVCDLTFLGKIQK